MSRAHSLPLSRYQSAFWPTSLPEKEDLKPTPSQMEKHYTYPPSSWSQRTSMPADLPSILKIRSSQRHQQTQTPELSSERRYLRPTPSQIDQQRPAPSFLHAAACQLPYRSIGGLPSVLRPGPSQSTPSSSIYELPSDRSPPDQYLRPTTAGWVGRRSQDRAPPEKLLSARSAKRSSSQASPPSLPARPSGGVRGSGTYTGSARPAGTISGWRRPRRELRALPRHYHYPECFPEDQPSLLQLRQGHRGDTNISRLKCRCATTYVFRSC